MDYFTLFLIHLSANTPIQWILSILICVLIDGSCGQKMSCGPHGVLSLLVEVSWIIFRTPNVHIIGNMAKFSLSPEDFVIDYQVSILQKCWLHDSKNHDQLAVFLSATLCSRLCWLWKFAVPCKESSCIPQGACEAQWSQSLYHTYGFLNPGFLSKYLIKSHKIRWNL